MRILVTGGTGWLGRALIPHLLAQSHTVIPLLREPYGMGTPLPAPLNKLRTQFDPVYADLRNYHQTARALAEAAPDIVIHLAAAGVTDPFLSLEATIRHNMMATIHLARACFERGGQVKRLITARTPGELTLMNSYAAGKAAAWDFCRMFVQTQRWPIVGAMVFQAYGCGQSPRNVLPAALKAALAGEDFPMTAGGQARDWIYIDDVVAGLEKMVSAEITPGTTLDLGNGKPISVADAVTILYKLVNRGGKPLIGALPTRPGEVPNQMADVTTTAAHLNWQPTIPLRQGLKNILDC